MQVAEEELLRVAASVEGSTRHPLADAVLAAAKERSPAALPAATESSTEPGQGVRATVGGKVVAVGKLDWVQSQAGGSHSSAPMSEAQQWQVRCSSFPASPYDDSARSSNILSLAVLLHPSFVCCSELLSHQPSLLSSSRLAHFVRPSSVMLLKHFEPLVSSLLVMRQICS